MNLQKNILLILFIGLFFIPVNSNAQSKIITGKVTDLNGIELIAVTVAVKGTTIGAITSPTGDFSLTIPEDIEEPVLVISYVGMSLLRFLLAVRSTSTYNYRRK